ncbi:transmembrane protein 59-like isoform X2 [Latimeria chalumnae]|uniref:transmembrane protein 59-like isoform X2 n=1 Tax=Latimeria chalumnae TaxID=7897 RepID=UPI0003C119A5|nr:PREDICTED: transmembrane protein 59-like isoform X2 [Latimeria chalumnae]|eukprot:XP_006003988.1 PREDICTED: transmembrane protein 59-like isoform X2 [Latimeria chalumnae]
MAAQCGNCGVLPFISLVLLSVALVAADLFDPQLGDTNPCQKQCQIIFKNRSSAKQEASQHACSRGCRLFSICHFVDGNSGLNITRAECESACREAYSKTEEQYGCTTGCWNQLPEMENRRKKLQSLVFEPRSFSLYNLVSSFCGDIVSSAQSFISSTWTFYLQADDGKVVVFQSQPEMEYPVPDVQTPKSKVVEKPLPHPKPNPPKPPAGYPDSLEKLAEALRQESKRNHVPQHLEPQQQEHDFLGCMSKRSGLPRWILAACLFLSIMVMLWLSCASLVTAPDQHIKSQLSINGDKEYLDEMEKPSPYSITPVIAVTICQSDENEEAGPLPIKVDLDKTII